MAGPATPARRAQDRVDVARLALLFHALSDETRLRIIGKLLHGEQCVCNLMDTLYAGQSRLSFHMKTLKDAGLVTVRSAGTRHIYGLDPTGVAATRDYFDQFWTTTLAAYAQATSTTKEEQ